MNTKQLRQRVLDLAIHGRLVPQNPDDEPASVLLIRIKAEKERLVKEGKIKKSKGNSNPIDEVPFEVPKGWCWCRLGELCSEISDIDHKMPSQVSEGIPYISPLNFTDDGKIDYKSAKLVSQADYNSLSRKCKPEKGDIIFPRYGTIGKLRIIDTDQPILVSYSCATLKTKLYSVDYDYVFYALLSDHIQIKEINKYKNDTTQANVGLESIKIFTIPLPPLAEQHRIVEAVEKWFSVIDLLESSENDLRKAITQAKSKILDLAINGKLVEKEGEWKFVTLASITKDSADGPFGSNLKREHYTTNKEVRIIQLSNIGEDGWRNENTKYTTFEHLTVIARSEVHPGDIVIAKMMPAGRAILCPSADAKYVLSSDAVKFVLKDGVYNQYVLNAINSSYFREQVYADVQGVTRVRTSLKKLRDCTIPLPPLAEQHRIVAKIEELFAKLDRISEALQ